MGRLNNESAPADDRPIERRREDRPVDEKTGDHLKTSGSQAQTKAARLWGPEAGTAPPLGSTAISKAFTASAAIGSSFGPLSHPAGPSAGR